MRKLVYWVALHKTDSQSYAIRARTRKECVEERAKAPELFATPVKVTVPYEDVVDLVKTLLGEGGESCYYTDPPDRYETEDEG